MTRAFISNRWRLRLTSHVQDESGAGTLASLFTFFIALLVGSLAIDYSNGIRTKAQLQVVADSAAMAGIAKLSEGPEEARAAAIAHSDRFGPNLLRAEDVQIGSWASGTFSSSGQYEPNAVRVATRRDKRNSNPVPTHLMFLLGINHLDVSAPAIAASVKSRAKCSGGGYFARGHLRAQSSNDYLDGICIHGEESVRFQNTNYFELGTVVSSPSVSDIIGHRSNPGLEDAMRAASHDFSFAEALTDIIDDIRDLYLAAESLPPYITGGPIFLDEITSDDTLQQGMLYFVDGDVYLRGDRWFEDVAIIANGDIDIHSQVTLRNVVLVSDQEISTNSNVEIGGTADDYCLRDTYSAYLLAQGDISFNSNNTLRGIFMASQGDIVMNSNNVSTEGLYAEALGDITYNSAATKRGCLSAYDNEMPFHGATVRLMQ